MACLLASKAGTIWVRACFRKLYSERCWWAGIHKPASIHSFRHSW